MTKQITRLGCKPTMKRLMALLSITLISFFAVITPAAAASPYAGGSLAVNNPCFPGLILSFTDAGTFYVNVYDDGNLLDTAALNVPAGGKFVFILYAILNPVQNGTPGIDFEVTDGSTVLDTFSFTSFDNAWLPLCQLYASQTFHIPSAGLYTQEELIALMTITQSGFCSAQLPSNAVQGRIQTTTTAYYAASLEAMTSITLDGGTSWFIMGAQDGFYQLYISCDASPVWVAASAVEPNFDGVWNGAALPDASTGQ